MSVKPFDPADEENNQDNPPQNESVGGLSRIETSQINQQVATAKQYPRSIKKFMATASAMVTFDEDVAWECVYRLKRKERDGRDKFIEGPSVRLLEIAASAYGNLYYGSRILGEDGDNIVAEGVAWDLENNVRASQQVLRRIVTKDGNKYGSDMLTMTANAAASIAKRNALNGIVPRVYVNSLMEKAKEVSSKSAKPFGERVQKCLEKFKAIRVTEEQILEKLEIDELAKMTPDHLELLYGTFTAIRDGDTTIEQEFPIEAKSTAPTFVGKPAEPKPEKKKKAEPATPPAAPTNVVPIEQKPPDDIKNEPSPKNEPPIQDGSKLSGDVPTGADLRTSAAAAPEPAKKGQKRAMLESFMQDDGITEEQLVQYMQSSSPVLLKPGQNFADMAEAKCNLVCSMWKQITEAIKGGK